VSCPHRAVDTDYLAHPWASCISVQSPLLLIILPNFLSEIIGRSMHLHHYGLQICSKRGPAKNFVVFAWLVKGRQLDLIDRIWGHLSHVRDVPL